MRTGDRRAAREFSPVGVEERYPPPTAWIHPDRSRSWVRRVLPLVLSNRSTLLVAWISTAVVAVLFIAGAFVLRNAVNVLREGDLIAARTAALTLVVLALVRFATGYVSRTSMFRAAYRLEYALRSIIYEHLTRLSFAFYDRVQSGQLISRANTDIRSVQMFLTFLPTVAIQVMTFGIVLVLMLGISWELTLATCVPLPFVFWFGLKMRRQIFPVSWIVQARMADLATIVEENVTGVRIIKSFAAEQRQIEELAKTARRMQWASIKMVDIRARYSPVIENLLRLGLVFILLFGGFLVVRGRLDIGAIVLYQQFLAHLTAPFRVIGFLVILHERARASAGRIYEILDTPPDVTDRPGAVDLTEARGDVELRDVHFGYADGPDILDGFSLHLRPGETVALVGRTGSGKSTVARLIMRFYDVRSGAVLVDGRDVRDLTQESLRAHIGLVADDAFLFSDTVRNNIAYARPDASLDDVVAAAKASGSHAFVERLPNGYDTQVGERGYDLSGGQRQRISIARLLLMDPEILILDDATSSVDVQVEQEIHGALRRVMEGRTTLIIAHRLSTIGLADRVVLLEDGRVVASGAHADLMRTEPRYAEVLTRWEEEDQRRTEPPPPAGGDRPEADEAVLPGPDDTPADPWGLP